MGCTSLLGVETTGGGFLTRERTFLIKELERANGDEKGLLRVLGWVRKGVEVLLFVTWLTWA